MRFPSSLGLQRARGRGGVILENDGEVILPPVSQPVGSFGAPYETNALPPTGPIRTSHLLSEFNVAGFPGTVAFSFVTLGSGTWNFSINFFVDFSGTPERSKSFRFQLNDPNGLTRNIFFFPNVLAQGIFQTNMEMTFSVDGWFFGIASDAALVGQSTPFGASILCQKLL